MAKPYVASERALIHAKAHYIWQTTGIRVEEDFPPEIDSKRKVLKPILIAASKIKDNTGRHKHKASLRTDKLNIDGKIYTINNLDKLPTALKVQKNIFFYYFIRQTYLN